MKPNPSPQFSYRYFLYVFDRNNHVGHTGINATYPVRFIVHYQRKITFHISGGRELEEDAEIFYLRVHDTGYRFKREFWSRNPLQAGIASHAASAITAHFCFT